MVGRLLGFVVLAALLALVVIVVLRARDFIADRAQRSLTGPDLRRQQALDEARHQLRRAEKAHAKRVRRARKQLVEAGRDPVLTQVGPVILGACTVTVKKTVHELSSSTVFRVEVQGEIRQVVTRRGAEEKVVRDDQREVFLTITDDAWADVVQLPPAKLEGVRRLEAMGAAAVRNLSTAQDDRDVRVLAAQAELERVIADTAEVDAARMTLEDLEGVGPWRIDVPEPPPSTGGIDPPRAPGDEEDEEDEEDEDDQRPGDSGTPRR